ncbi:MAG: RNA polymerase sigma factor [Methylomonas sp.]
MAKLDQTLVSHLFLNHRHAIHNHLVSRVECPAIAEDLTQEAFLRLLNKNSVEHDENLAGYVFRIAERLAIDFIRHQRRHSNHVELDNSIPSNAIETEQLTILRQQCEILLSAIAELPTRCRNVFLLRKIDELSYNEIAQQLGISEKTVQRDLVNAMLHCHHRLQFQPF